MYTGSPPPDFRHAITEAEKADGFVHPCDQHVLMFGQDRRQAAVTRPVVRIRQHLEWAIVLPCTTKEPRNPEDFFELTDQRVMWATPEDRKSFAYWRYEPVSMPSLRSKIGVMHQSARIKLLQWLKERI